jgi:hypothetical protein
VQRRQRRVQPAARRRSASASASANERLQQRRDARGGRMAERHTGYGARFARTPPPPRATPNFFQAREEGLEGDKGSASARAESGMADGGWQASLPRCA